MVYDIAWRACHGIWYGLEKYGMVYCMAWHIVWLGRHGMVYDDAWRGIAWYVEMLMWVSCFMALPWTMVPFTFGGPVHSK